MASIQRSALVLLAALCLAAVAGIFLARRMVVPIQALRTGAARIGSGDLSQRIEVKTGDELEALADQFNDMAGRLQESYTGLENKVEQRTQELAQSVKELRALGEVTQAVNSTVDLETVLSTIVAKAVQLSNTHAGAIYVFDEVTEEFKLRATYGLGFREQSLKSATVTFVWARPRSVRPRCNACRSKFRTFRTILQARSTLSSARAFALS